MSYMAATAVQRSHPEHLLEGCRSVIVVAMSYRSSQPDSDALPAGRSSVDLEVRMGTRLSPLDEEAARAAGTPTRGPPPRLLVAGRGRHRTAARARVGGPRGSRLDRQEHHAPQPPTRLRALSRRPAHRCRIRARSNPSPTTAARCTACLDACPTEAFPEALCPRRSTLYRIPHRGTPRRDPGRVRTRHGRHGGRLRPLQRGLPVDQKGAGGSPPRVRPGAAPLPPPHLRTRSAR